MEHARAATPDDLAAVTALATAAIEELAIQRGGDVWRATLARPEPVGEGLARDLARPAGEGIVVVGTVDGAVVGYGCTRLAEVAGGARLATITDLYVDPGARGIGVGEAMADLLIEHARQCGAVGVDSLALPGDRATKNFFETFGLKARAIVVHRSLLDEEGGGGAA